MCERDLVLNMAVLEEDCGGAECASKSAIAASESDVLLRAQTFVYADDQSNSTRALCPAVPSHHRPRQIDRPTNENDNNLTSGPGHFGDKLWDRAPGDKTLRKEGDLVSQAGNDQAPAAIKHF